MVTVPFRESIETNNVSSDIGVIAIYVCVSVMQKHKVVLPKQHAAADPVLGNTTTLLPLTSGAQATINFYLGVTPNPVGPDIRSKIRRHSTMSHAEYITQS